jgi:glycosyltransferase involved in cell wall biosynthesis
MIGTGLNTFGGISSVVNVYARHGLFSRWNLKYIATHCDGSRLRKLRVAVIAWVQFVGLLLTFRVDLVHVHCASGPSFWRKAVFIAPASLLRVPFIVHIHGGGFHDFYEERCNDFGRRMIRRVLQSSRAVVALSEEWRATLLEIAPRGHVIVIPNPVDIPIWRANLDSNPPTVLFLGLLSKAKGVDDLVAAWPAVLEAVPGAILIMAGNGDTNRVRRLFQHKDFECSIQLPGWVGGRAKTDLLKCGWVLALPSYREALPMSVLEAMAAGLPVVATRIGGLPLAVRDGISGTLIEAGDVGTLSKALISVLTNRQERHRLGAEARKRAIAEFSADVILSRLEDLWRDAMRG